MEVAPSLGHHNQCLSLKFNHIHCTWLLHGHFGWKFSPRDIYSRDYQVKVTKLKSKPEEEEEERVQLGHCASLLAPSSTAGWVSCNEKVANARAHYNLIIQRFIQSAVPLYCQLWEY